MRKLRHFLGLAGLIVWMFGLREAVAEAVTPSLEQRVAGLEAYMTNGDPTTALKDSNGAVPDGLTTATSAVPGPGHNGWTMTSTALVLFMTLPGLALFYGGLVRRKNVLSVMAQCLAIGGMVTILWWAGGYSIVFGDRGAAGSDSSTFLGGLAHVFLTGVGSTPNTNYSYWVSQNVFAMFQLMFAIITPALILGAIAERMKFAALLAFTLLWMLLVYFPLAHMVWGIDGAMNGAWNAMAAIKAIDFAGGTVVHMSSGWSALILCLLLGRRLGFPREPMPPHSMVICVVGTGMLWVGWYGFNAGSALAADGIAAIAFTNTTLAAAVASSTWAVAEYLAKGKPSVLGLCSGAVAGLVVVTPGCGFVTSGGAVLMGLAAGLVPFAAVSWLKPRLGYDDALDAFGIHGVGGTMGALLTGMLARKSVNSNLATNLADKVTDSFFQPLVIEQLKAILMTMLLAVAMTAIIAIAVKATVGLRADEEVETIGLDLSEHGEEGYHGA